MEHVDVLEQLRIENFVDLSLLEKSVRPLRAGLLAADWFGDEGVSLSVIAERGLDNLKVGTNLNINFGLNALSTAFILCYSDFIKRASVRCLEVGKRLKVSDLKKYELWRMGPKVKNAYWSQAVIAASNYIRHYEDWRNAVGINFPVGALGDGVADDIKPEWELRFGEVGSNQLRDIMCLVDVGIGYDKILGKSWMAGFDIALALGLFDLASGVRHFEDWCGSIEDRLLSEINGK